MKCGLLTSLPLAGVLALSGCAEQRMREQVQAATAKRDAAMAACMTSSPMEAGHFVSRQQCMSNAREAWAAETGFRDADLIYAADANVMQDAVKADQGQTSPAQYEADIRSIWADVALVQHQRNEDAQAAEFPRRQASAAALLQWNALQQQQRQQQQYQPFQFRQPAPLVSPSVNCMTNYVGTTAYTRCN